MEKDRRPVRVTPEFFADLDQQLPAHRDASGAPSAHDFLVHDLLVAVEVFLPPAPSGA